MNIHSILKNDQGMETQYINYENADSFYQYNVQLAGS
jgi:hypothetical protein